MNEEIQEVVRRQLIDAITADFAPNGEIAAAPTTSIRLYPAPFLKRHSIYIIENLQMSYKPLGFTVGFAPPDSFYWLPGYPQNFVTMARADKVSIETEQMALSYALTSRDVTKPLTEVLYTISSFEDIRFLPDSTLDTLGARQQYQALEQRYKHEIVPPHVQTQRKGFLVTLYAIHKRNLLQCTLTITPDGYMWEKEKVVESNLPLAFSI